MPRLFFLLFLIGAGRPLLADENVIPLPEIVQPLNYTLTLLPVLDGDVPRLCGHVWIDVLARLPTTMLILHSSELDIRRTVVQRVLSASPEGYQPNLAANEVGKLCFNPEPLDDEQEGDMVVDMHQDNGKEMLTILLKDRLVTGARYRIGILYTGNIQLSEAKGFFRRQYQPSNGNDPSSSSGNCCLNMVGATQLEAIYARKVFPCLDEPAYKSSFRLIVGHDSSFTALSNMPIQSSWPVAGVDNWAWDEFLTTPPMPTYLLAIIVARLVFLETSYESLDGRNVTIRLWTQPGQTHQLLFAMDFVPKVLETLEEYLRTPYTLPKLDIVAVPGYEEGKAMENWGLIVHSETNLLWDPNTSSLVDRTLIAVTIVHELSHQWFGNLVTCRWWDDIWLFEGLTTFFEVLIANQIDPGLDAEMVKILFLEEVMKLDLLASHHSLNEPVAKFKTIEDKFDAIAYAKGGAMFRMAKDFVGEEAFQTATVRFIQQYQYGNANSTDFWVLLNQEARRTHSISCRMNVARIMKTWTQQPGYPLVHVHRAKDGTVHLSQKPFQDATVTSKIDNATMAISASWWIPISMTDAESLKFQPADRAPILWLSPRRPSVEIPGPKKNESWVLVNLESSGYYRVNYDRRSWELLAAQLEKNHSVIPLVTRAQLVDDAFSLAHAKIIPYDIPTMLIQYLTTTGESDGLIRKISNKHVDFFVENMSQEDPEEQRVARMLSNVSRSRGVEGRSRSNGPALVDGYCDAGDELCVAEALNLFRDTMDGTASAQQFKMVTDHFEEVWCAALRHGGRPEWTFAWEASRKSTDVVDKRRTRMLRAMCCTVDPAQQKQLLSRVFHPNIGQRPKETSVILAGLTENRSARPMVLNFVLQNWAFLTKHFRDSVTMGDSLVALVKHLPSPEDVDKVNKFVEEHRKELGPALSDRTLGAMVNGRVAHQTQRTTLSTLKTFAKSSIKAYNDITKWRSSPNG